jgi:hypothetical protein
MKKVIDGIKINTTGFGLVYFENGRSARIGRNKNGTFFRHKGKVHYLEKSKSKKRSRKRPVRRSKRSRKSKRKSKRRSKKAKRSRKSKRKSKRRSKKKRSRKSKRKSKRRSKKKRSRKSKRKSKRRSKKKRSRKSKRKSKRRSKKKRSRKSKRRSKKLSKRSSESNSEPELSFKDYPFYKKKMPTRKEDLIKQIDIMASFWEGLTERNQDMSLERLRSEPVSELKKFFKGYTSKGDAESWVEWNT